MDLSKNNEWDVGSLPVIWPNYWIYFTSTAVLHLSWWLLEYHFHTKCNWLNPQDLSTQTILVREIIYCCFFVLSCSFCLIFSFYLCIYFHLGKPTCRCNVGFSGPFCERRICDNYCLNGGTCDITQGNQPVCRCMAEYTGDRCLYRESYTHYSVAANTTNNWCHAFSHHDWH